MKIIDKFETWLTDGAPQGTLGDETEYPIAGCREVLARIEAEISKLNIGARVLLVGACGENIAINLYRKGYDVWFVSDTVEQLTRLSHKMPRAHMILSDVYDLGETLEYVASKTNTELYFDIIALTYIMHSASTEEQPWVVEQAYSFLLPGRKILIGDICFWTSAEREICRRRCSSTWDSEANYLVFDSFRNLFVNDCVTFTRLTHCSGVFSIVEPEFDYDDEDDELEDKGYPTF